MAFRQNSMTPAIIVGIHDNLSHYLENYAAKENLMLYIQSCKYTPTKHNIFHKYTNVLACLTVWQNVTDKMNY